MDRIPEEKGDLVETEEILDVLSRREMLQAKKTTLAEMFREDLYNCNNPGILILEVLL